MPACFTEVSVLLAFFYRCEKANDGGERACIGREGGVFCFIGCGFQRVEILYKAFAVETEIANSRGGRRGVGVCADEDASDGREKNFNAFDTTITDVKVTDWRAGFRVDYGVPLAHGFVASETGLDCRGDVCEAIEETEIAAALFQG